jgi:hypothetical protein
MSTTRVLALLCCVLCLVFPLLVEALGQSHHAAGVGAREEARRRRPWRHSPRWGHKKHRGHPPPWGHKPKQPPHGRKPKPKPPGRPPRFSPYNLTKHYHAHNLLDHFKFMTVRRQAFFSRCGLFQSNGADAPSRLQISKILSAQTIQPTAS